MSTLGSFETVRQLAEKLSACPEVSRYDTPEEPQGWTLAHSFNDLESSFTAFLEQQLLQLAREESSPKETYDLLMDIGEGFRHILYHLRDPRFYSYLQ
jgi:hypothetical protein